MSDLLWLLAVPLAVIIDALCVKDSSWRWFFLQMWRRRRAKGWRKLRAQAPRPRRIEVDAARAAAAKLDARLAEAIAAPGEWPGPGFYQANITNHATPVDEPRARWDAYPPPSPEPVVRPG